MPEPTGASVPRRPGEMEEVDFLRAFADWLPAGRSGEKEDLRRCADEIERLRAAVESLHTENAALREAGEALTEAAALSTWTTDEDALARWRELVGPAESAPSEEVRDA